jgi:predicted DNA-binding protein (MmcQ/YjbR family)
MPKAKTSDPFHDRLLAMVLELPGATEDWPWGSIHCKVDGKIFVGWGRTEDGDMSVGLRVDRMEQANLVAHDGRFSIAKYSGKYGGVDFRIGKRPDWVEVERYVVGSYRIVAPKKRVKELDAMLGAQAKAATRTRGVNKR